VAIELADTLSQVETEDPERKEKEPNAVSSESEKKIVTSTTGSVVMDSKVKVKDKSQSLDFRGFVAVHHVAFSLAFSALLVIGGIVLLLSSLPSAIPHEGIPSIFGIVLPQWIGITFASIGVLLLISPSFFNRFVFDALNYERELRIRAQKSTREAQLLQDILTHDVRNYNQVSKLSAELLAEEFKDNSSAQDLVDRLLESIDGSTLLVQRAKMLGKVISDQSLNQRPVNVLLSIRRSMNLISASTPDRKINTVVKLGSNAVAPLDKIDPEAQPVDVIADDLIDEVFANLFSNSVKYSKDGEQTFIGIEVDRVRVKDLKGKDCWKIAISDTGKGIPDELKPALFSRYLDGAKGSGLGMSIVHALVVGRYQGKIQVENRNERDHSEGTVVELFLPAA
jgi:signal transduction histidine kinase